MTPEQIQVTTVSATWNPERADEAFADGRYVVDVAFIANPDALKGVHHVVVNADEWSMRIYCTESPSETQKDLWRSIWKGMTNRIATNRIMRWYDMSQPAMESRMDTHEKAYYLGLERMVEVLHAVIGGKWSKENARAVDSLRWSLDAWNHELIDDIVNAIAHQVHLRKEGKQ